MKKKIIISLIVIIGAVITSYNYIYKEARNISEETPEYILSSKNLKVELNNSQDAVVKKYLDKTIQVSGKVTEVNKNFLMLDGYITVYLINKQKTLLSINDEIFVKGRFIGYDELLEELKLDQSTIINKQ